MNKYYTLLILSLIGQFVFGQLHCNDSIPGWGDSLGVVSFKTDRTWIIGNQEWSDVVMAEGCRKNKFDGIETIKIYKDAQIYREYTISYFDSTLSYNADCRKNWQRYGDLFSWCAVIRYQDQLCPDDWRVPTVEDFRALHTALGGQDVSTSMGYKSEIIRDNYINIWGAAFSGWCTSDGELQSQYEHARYWTQSEDSNGKAISFFLYSIGNIIPEDIAGSRKNHGFTVRCVRDK